jgi:hypothetical protein
MEGLLIRCAGCRLCATSVICTQHECVELFGCLLCPFSSPPRSRGWRLPWSLVAAARGDRVTRKGEKGGGAQRKKEPGHLSDQAFGPGSLRRLFFSAWVIMLPFADSIILEHQNRPCQAGGSCILGLMALSTSPDWTLSPRPTASLCFPRNSD